MNKQKKMTKQILKLNEMIKNGYKVNWKETKQKGNKTLITIEKIN